MDAALCERRSLCARDQPSNRDFPCQGNHAFIEYDYTAQAPFFYYRDASQKQHVVWFEDARSIQAKFDLLKELSLRGVSYWKLGWDFPQNWLLLEDRFQIIKK